MLKKWSRSPATVTHRLLVIVDFQQGPFFKGEGMDGAERERLCASEEWMVLDQFLDGSWTTRALNEVRLEMISRYESDTDP